MFTLTRFYDELQKILMKHSESLGDQTDSSAALGEDREFFIRTVLQRSLPLNVTPVRGVVVDREGAESNPQDIVLYRADFPILSGFVGSRRFLAEGVVACIEVKSNLNGKEFQRARKTLGSVSGKRGYGVAIPQNLSEEASSEYVRIVQANGYTKNQISTRRYIFGYQGVTLGTLKKYVLDMLRSGNSFWELPSAICILSRGICLIRDDGQVLPPYPAAGSSQSIYCVMQEGERALEFFMLHVLSSCLLAGGDLRVYGTPLRFHIYNYMEQPVHVKSLRGDIQQDLSKLKIAWKGKSHITTNDVLTRWEFEQQKC